MLLLMYSIVRGQFEISIYGILGAITRELWNIPDVAFHEEQYLFKTFFF